MLKKLGKTKTIKQDQSGLEVPPGQYVTEKFPVLTEGPVPPVDLKTWRFRMFGLVEKEKELTWEQFLSLPQVKIDAAFHCVTQWSRLQNTWEGVLFSEVLKLVKSLPQAKFAMIHCLGGYSTNLSLTELLDNDVLFAHRHDGALLSKEHGGPLRLVVPKLYGWKSAKWANGIELMQNNKPGFWEERGYNMHGDPWKEERFWPELS